MDGPASEPARAPRMALLIGSFHPVVGGGERHARLLARAWARHDASAWVVTRRRHPTSRRHEQLDGFAILRVGPSGFPRLGKYLMLPAALLALWKRRHDYDVLYVCGLRVLGVVGLGVQALTGKPCILRAEARGEWNGAFVWQSPEGRVRRMRRWVFRPLVNLRNAWLKQARGFVAISTPVLEEFIEGGIPEARIARIPNGIDTEVFRPIEPGERAALRRELGFPDGRVFVYSGKLNRGKGLEHLLRVWRSYAADRPRDRLVLVGSGKGQSLSCEEHLRTFVEENGLEASVVFTGYTERVADYLRAADGFLFPSESEAQGLAPLEAMACGLPVIASRIPGVMDMIRDGENGTLVDPRDEAGWLAAMRRLADGDEAFPRQAVRALETVRTRYGIRAVFECHRAFFEEALKGAHQSSQPLASSV